jgi:acetylornithine deacetylase/succinyl-diaminopimelate desuccinylase-like protein
MPSPDAIPFLPCLSTPRPNGSPALERTVQEVQAWLEREGIPVHRHRFTLRPYFMELLGLWMALTGLLLPLAALARWGWFGLALAVVATAVPLLEVRTLRPTVSAVVRRPAHNLIAAFPAPHPEREVILAAHLDSKTELLDHVQRQLLLLMALPAAALTVASGLLTALEPLLPPGGPATVVRWLAVAASLPVAAYGMAMAANLIGGRFSRHPSTGAVDNGAAVAVLLALARRLRRREPTLARTSVTLLFTVGEEAQLQGALAYVRDRVDWPLPTVAVNQEVLGQDGGYLLWESDGTAMSGTPCDPALNLALEGAAEAVTGERLLRAPAISSDAFAFLRRGIPATTLGSFDRELGGRGLHSALDHPDRVDPARLAETVELLTRFLTDLDAHGLPHTAEAAKGGA